MSVAVGANLLAFSLYGGGIFDAACGTELTHAVLAVGYDLDQGYILVKNSWGKFWGEEGYIRLALDKNNGNGQCGVAMLASYPVSVDPLAPRPTPSATIQCGLRAYCHDDESCCCMSQVWSICFQWGCCPGKTSTCCRDMKVNIESPLDR